MKIILYISVTINKINYVISKEEKNLSPSIRLILIFITKRFYPRLVSVYVSV